MGLIGKLFRQHDDTSLQVLERPPREACFHTTATPEWDNLNDMGKEERIARFRCPSCNQVFSAEEFRRVQREDAQRMAKAMEPGTSAQDDA